MKLLITGCNGFLGGNLVHYFSSRPGYELVGTSRREIAPYADMITVTGDLLDRAFVSSLIAEHKPDTVINCVGLANIEVCEADPQLAVDINAHTAGVLSAVCQPAGIRLVHISTDHLFQGDRGFYSEEDSPSPVNEYGRTKLVGERMCLDKYPEALVVRTNFYGWSYNGHSMTFGEWIYKSLKEQKAIFLFTDYYFSAIEVTALCAALEKTLQDPIAGILNIVSSERFSKYDFGVALGKVCSFDISQVTPSVIQSDSFKVQRQLDLSLSTKKYESLFGHQLPGLLAGLETFSRRHRG
jgi:dTDP-4-dehydrorhamnose reductase